MNDPQNKNKKFIAWDFLVISILLDIFVISHTTSQRTIDPVIISIAALFALIVKTTAILMGHYRYNNWQYSYEKNKVLKRRTILIMIIADVILVIAGVVNWYNEIHNNMMQIIEALMGICGILTIPAIITSLFIGPRGLKSIKNKINIIKKITAWSFLIISLLIDIATAFMGMVPWIGYGLSTIMIVGFCAIPFSIIKVLAILLGHFRHDDWQYDYRKITSHRMRTALLIIAVDAVSIIIVGIISNFGAKECGDGGCNMMYGRGLKIAKEIALAFGFSSIPALFASVIIDAIGKKVEKKNLIK